MIILGLMSGTSADGIDVAIAEIQGNRATLSIDPIDFQTLPWPPAVHRQIFRLFEGDAPTELLCQSHFTLATCFADAALEAIAAAGLTTRDVDLIGSHGQTLWHAVDTSTGQVTSTLQAGDPSVIAARTGITTVANFRTADIAAGGQGAPLVSTLDWLLLRPEPGLNGFSDGWRAIQNIGGIGNVTLLPPRGNDAQPLAFDTGPGNVLLDWAATVITEGHQKYDVAGALAARGSVDGSLLESWMMHPYFEKPPPKTTGREVFSEHLFLQWRREARARALNDRDFLATLTGLTAASIATAYADFAPGTIAQVVVAGGGAHNQTLLTQLREQLYAALGRDVEVLPHAALGIDGDAKEALTFALLAYLAIHGWSGNVPACTGAKTERILGQIAPGTNWNELMKRR